MSNVMTITYDAVDRLSLEDDGNYHIRIPTFYGFDSYSNDRIDFIFDTGAYITVLSRQEAVLFDFMDNFTIKSNVPISGFAGSCLVDIKEIPGFVVGGKRLEGVKVAVPHIDTDVNILGLNVIELFKYYIDTEKYEIYFSENPLPSIPDFLQCKKIHQITSDVYFS